MSIREDLSALNAFETTDGGNADRDKAPMLSFHVVWLMILSRAVIPQNYTQPHKPSHVQNIKADVAPDALSEGTVDQERALLHQPSFVFLLNEV